MLTENCECPWFPNTIRPLQQSVPHDWRMPTLHLWNDGICLNCSKKSYFKCSMFHLPSKYLLNSVESTWQYQMGPTNACMHILAEAHTKTHVSGGVKSVIGRPCPLCCDCVSFLVRELMTLSSENKQGGWLKRWSLTTAPWPRKTHGGQRNMWAALRRPPRKACAHTHTLLFVFHWYGGWNVSVLCLNVCLCVLWVSA